jgi:hypothetical protein
MNQFDMSEVLRKLEDELNSDVGLNDYEKNKTIALSDHIRAMLAREDENMSGDDFLLSKLKQQLEEFEVEHPEITEIVGRLSDLLARSGL